MAPKKKIEPAPTDAVVLFMLETDRGVWACYLDGLLVAWGGSEMTARELLSVLKGRPISVERWLDMGDYAPDEFPRHLADVPTRS